VNNFSPAKSVHDKEFRLHVGGINKAAIVYQSRIQNGEVRALVSGLCPTTIQKLERWYKQQSTIVQKEDKVRM
jgi:hypothetical protein